MLWINGQCSVGADLILDEGFFFGLGVFETIRVHAKPLFWHEHLARLNQSLSALGIRPAVDPDELLAEVAKLEIQQCVLKIAVSPANIVMQTRPLPDPQNGGYRLTLAGHVRSTNPLLLQNKCLSYMDNLLAWEKARKQGFTDAIMVNASGHVAETSRANLFFFVDGQLHTPDIECGLLNGIVRQWVLANFPVRTGAYSFQEILSADSVFITNSVIGIQMVEAIDNRQYAPAPRIEQVRSIYEAFIRD